MTNKQYEKRDAAFEAHIKSDPDRTEWTKDVARAAFNAGWEARKRTEYEAMVERPSLTSNDPKFTLYWRGGKHEVIQGRTIAEAMTLAGYGGGAVRALDFYASGDNTEYKWIESSREWVTTSEIA
jgi:hypothetical protein